MTRSRIRRRVRPDEVLQISRCIGAGWKHLGNALKFSYAQLDQIESEKPDSLQDRVEYMLLLWINWQCEKATVNSLTKQLFKHKEYDAILAIEVQNEWKELLLLYKLRGQVALVSVLKPAIVKEK